MLALYHLHMFKHEEFGHIKHHFVCYWQFFIASREISVSYLETLCIHLMLSCSREGVELVCSNGSCLVVVVPLVRFGRENYVPTMGFKSFCHTCRTTRLRLWALPNPPYHWDCCCESHTGKLPFLLDVAVIESWCLLVDLVQWSTFCLWFLCRYCNCWILNYICMSHCPFLFWSFFIYIN